MNIKQWIALLILYVGYLVLGAMLFYYLEKDHEMIKRNEDFQLYKDLVGNARPLSAHLSFPSLFLLIFFPFLITFITATGNIIFSVLQYCNYCSPNLSLHIFRRKYLFLLLLASSVIIIE